MKKKPAITVKPVTAKPGTFNVTLSMGSDHAVLSKEAEQTFIELFKCPVGSLKPTKHLNTFVIDVNQYLTRMN